MGTETKTTYLPDVVAGRQSGQGGIGSVLNLRHGPLPTVEVAKTRSVGGANDLVTVALQAEQEDGLPDTAAPPRVRHQVAIPADTTVGVSGSRLACR